MALTVNICSLPVVTPAMVVVVNRPRTVTELESGMTRYRKSIAWPGVVEVSPTAACIASPSPKSKFAVSASGLGETLLFSPGSMMLISEIASVVPADVNLKCESSSALPTSAEVCRGEGLTVTSPVSGSVVFVHRCR